MEGYLTKGHWDIKSIFSYHMVFPGAICTELFQTSSSGLLRMGYHPIWGRYWCYRAVNPFWRNHHHLNRSLCWTSWYLENPKWVWLHIHCVCQVSWYNTANSGNFGTSVFESVCSFLCYAWREWVRWHITFCCWPLRSRLSLASLRFNKPNLCIWDARILFNI